MNILRISKSLKNEENVRKMILQKFTGSYKKILFFVLIIDSTFSMDNWTHNFKNTLTSSYHDNFRLDIFYSKTFSYSFFWDRKTD